VNLINWVIGLVTRFDMKVYPQGSVWGGLTFHDISLGIRPLEYLVNFIQTLREDPKGMSYVTYAWDPINSIYSILMPHIYLEPEEYPSPLFSELPELETTNSTLRITDINGVGGDIADSNLFGERTIWFSFMFTADAQASWDVFTAGQELFDPYRDSVQGFAWSVTFQPLARSMFAVSEDAAGGNPSGLTNDTGDLFCEFKYIYSPHLGVCSLFYFKCSSEQHHGWIRKTTN
jgi:hypothetical protein